MRCRALLGLVVLSLTVASTAAGQGGKGKSAPANQQTEKQKDTTPLVPLTDQQAVDYATTEMLGGWQIGDIELMHKSYADDVLIVSGYWEPPVQGWEKYIQAYKRQRGRMQGVELNRSNTYLKVVGSMAWVVYQWVFTGNVDGTATTYRGHTTLVYEHRGGKWLIVVNHTSIADVPPAAPNQPAANPPVPTKPS